MVHEQRAAHSLQGQKSGHSEPKKKHRCGEETKSWSSSPSSVRDQRFYNHQGEIGRGAHQRGILSVYIHVCCCVCSQLSTCWHICSCGQEWEDMGVYVNIRESLVHNLKANDAVSPCKDVCPLPSVLSLLCTSTPAVAEFVPRVP